MLILPTRAKQVRVVGGPQGTDIGPVGPTGPQAVTIVGPTGLEGVMGRLGVTGPAGLAGLLSAFVGPTGLMGPDMIAAYPGATGPKGSAGLPFNQMYHFQNSQGYVAGMHSRAMLYAGFKFIYEIRGSMSLVIMSGVFNDTASLSTWISVERGVGGAPVAGEIGGSSLSMGSDILAPGMSVPFMFVMGDPYSDDYPTPVQGEQRWVDMACQIHSNLSADTVGNSLTNINCVILEF